MVDVLIISKPYKRNYKRKTTKLEKNKGNVALHTKVRIHSLLSIIQV